VEGRRHSQRLPSCERPDEAEVPVLPTPSNLLPRLRAMDAVQLAALLEAVPGLADAAAGLPSPLLGHQEGLPPQPLGQLARALARPYGIVLTLRSLDAVALRLVELAAWHDDALDRETALAETGGAHAEALDRAAATLRDRLISEDAGGGWVVLRPMVAHMASQGRVRVADWLQGLSSGDLALIAGNLGVVDLPRTRGERQALVQALIRSPDVLAEVLEQLPDDSVRLLRRLIEEGPLHVRDLGIDYVTPRTYHGHRAEPLLVLRDLGYVDIDFGAQRAQAYLDVVVAANGGRRFSDWPVQAPTVEPAPLTAGPPRVPAVVEHLAALLRAWAVEPAEGLADGGLGVRPVRAAAKRLGLASTEVGLAAHLAMRLGVLGRTSVGTTGRGRYAKPQWRWTTTTLLEAWDAEPAPTRWALLVQAWCEDTRLDESEGLPERTGDGGGADGLAVPARRAFLDLLAEQPAGTGLGLDDLRSLAAWRAPALLEPPRVDGLVAAARVLGLVPAEGAVGLTDAARALLEGPEALTAILPEGRRELVVQADLTVITPPDADPDLTGELARYAELESDAGARVWRLSEARITRCLDEGGDLDEVSAFLTEHATAALPQNVSYLLADIGRRHGRVRAGAAGSYLRSDDPALLASAVAVRTAKLRLLAPTVAVSPLPRAKLVAALRDKGVSAVAEDADGAAFTATAQAKPAAPVNPRGYGEAPTLPPLRGPRPDALSLAHELLADEGRP
jgi:hypothetical protein